MDGKGSERFDTVVVGAGQAGLSAGFVGLNFVACRHVAHS